MLVTFSLLLSITAFAWTQECHKRDYSNEGHVCVCTSQYCDSIPVAERTEAPHYSCYTSDKAGSRFKKTQGTFTTTNDSFKNQIVIRSHQKYQNIIGWGGAFTDATGINIASLDEQAQDKLLESYFSDNGIGYNLCRVPIGSTDFSERGYSYADGRADPKLEHFRLAPEDYKYKIPLIKKAEKLAKGNLRLFASAWTAPKWMKTNGQYAGFGFLLENMYQAWADYFVKFLDDYEREGIKFWGITTGNEPSLGFVPFIKINSVGWTPNSMATWIRHNLGPTIRNSSHSNIKIMALDDQRFFLPWFINIVLKHNTTRNYVDGIAVHWYYDTLFPASLLRETHQNFPDKFLLATEACPGDKPLVLGSWQSGERYADDIIEDVLNWVGGWVDWNMALDLKGGPTYIDNFADSPIIVNYTAGEFYKQPLYYALGHFSKFIPKGSVRIGSSSFDKNVPIAAFQRPDNGTVVVILNKKDQVVPVAVVDDFRGSTLINLEKKSISTMLYW